MQLRALRDACWLPRRTYRSQRGLLVCIEGCRARRARGSSRAALQPRVTAPAREGPLQQRDGRRRGVEEGEGGRGVEARHPAPVAGRKRPGELCTGGAQAVWSQAVWCCDMTRKKSTTRKVRTSSPISQPPPTVGRPINPQWKVWSFCLALRPSGRRGFRRICDDADDGAGRAAHVRTQRGRARILRGGARKTRDGLGSRTCATSGRRS